MDLGMSINMGMSVKGTESLKFGGSSQNLVYATDQQNMPDVSFACKYLFRKPIIKNKATT